MVVPTRAQVEAMLASQIAEDPELRARLESNPRSVLSALIGMDIPDSVEVVLHEESLTQIHLTIPASDVISDNDLDLVAGGTSWGLEPAGPWGRG